MRSIILSFGFFFSCTVTLWSQVPQSTSSNPILLLAGEWVQKTTSIEPAPDSDSWKSRTTINEYSNKIEFYGNGRYRRIFARQ